MGPAVKCAAGGVHAMNWKEYVAICDVDNQFLCNRHASSHCSGHVLNKVIWCIPDFRSTNVIQCDNCEDYYDGSQWIGFTCSAHGFNVCRKCTSNNRDGAALLKNHRLNSHGLRSAVTWELFAPDEESRQPRDPLPRGYMMAKDIRFRDFTSQGLTASMSRSGIERASQDDDDDDVFYVSPSGFKLRKSGGDIPPSLQAKLDRTFTWNW